MSANRFQLAIAGLLLGGAAIIVVSQIRSQAVLRDENGLLRAKLAQAVSDNQSLSNRLVRIRCVPTPHLPAPTLQAVPRPESTAEASGTNIIARMMAGGDLPTLTAPQLKTYLEENHRCAASLLAGYRTSKDASLLEEAMEKYPGEPQVAFEAVFRAEASPAERREWLEAFKKAAPDNPMANYLAALDYFKSGQTDQAVQELIGASSRQRFTDYTAERIQSNQEAYRAAGYSEVDASMAATWGVTLPQLAQLKELARNMVDLVSAYGKAGDENSRQAALQMVLQLGGQLDAPPETGASMLNRLVGIAVQRMAFDSMDPAGAFGDGTVQQQLDQLAQRRASIKDLVTQTAPFRDQMTSADWLTYNQRIQNLGEENALRWLLNRYAPSQGTTRIR
jgi:hypothetical protein